MTIAPVRRVAKTAKRDLRDRPEAKVAAKAHRDRHAARVETPVRVRRGKVTVKGGRVLQVHRAKGIGDRAAPVAKGRTRRIIVRRMRSSTS